MPGEVGRWEGVDRNDEMRERRFEGEEGGVFGFCSW